MNDKAIVRVFQSRTDGDKLQNAIDFIKNEILKPIDFECDAVVEPCDEHSESCNCTKLTIYLNDDKFVGHL